MFLTVYRWRVLGLARWTEVHVLDILAGSCNELSRHFNGARHERSPTFSVNYLHMLQCMSRQIVDNFRGFNGKLNGYSTGASSVFSVFFWAYQGPLSRCFFGRHRSKLPITCRVSHGQVSWYIVGLRTYVNCYFFSGVWQWIFLI